MRSTILAALLLTAVLASSTNMEQLFDSWMAKYGVSYSSPSEEAQRFQTFCQNYKFIQEYNANHASSKLALNKFSDLTSAQFKALYTGLNHNQFAKTEVTSISSVIFDEKTVSNPTPDSAANFLGATQSVASSDGQTAGFVQHPFGSSWNWETQNVLNPVQNQGECGCCWSFSTTAAMEALNTINGNALVKFSEQQLVDCDTQDHGCNGGVPLYAMQYVAKNGMMLESAYPYQGEQAECKYNQAEATMVNNGGTDVPQGNSDALKSAIYQQPTVVGVDASNVIQHYASGVLDSSSGCTANLDHAVLAVGYGNFENKDAFVIRNSWGTDWGVNGYFYIATDSSDNQGMGTCGVLTNPTAPTGRKSVH